MSITNTLIAIDVSKDKLQVQTSDRAFEVMNNPQALDRFSRKLSNTENPFVVFEATGGYERPLMRALENADIIFCRANPARVRAFATSEGIRAKTDPIDAKVIMKFAQEKTLRPTVPSSPERQMLEALLDRHNHLSESITREKNRLQNSSPVIHESIERVLSFLKDESKAVTLQIRSLIKEDSVMLAQSKVLQRIVGVGETTTWHVLAYLEEICHINRNQLAALAGVAPFNSDSGLKKGKRKIMGGRAKVRKCLFMATKTAAQHNEIIRPYVQGLRDRGKPYKCAIVAGMRKMLIHMQSELKKAEYELA